MGSILESNRVIYLIAESNSSNAYYSIKKFTLAVNNREKIEKYTKEERASCQISNKM